MKKITHLSLLILTVFSVGMFSCGENSDPVVPEPSLDLVEDEFVINAAFEDLDYLTLEVLQSSGLGLRTTATADLCAGASVNHNQNTKTIVVDFGQGCTSPNGVLRKGKITMVYTGNNFLFPGTSISTTFQGYEVDGIRIDGTRTITNAGIDLVNSRITLRVKIENGKITWPDNSSVTYTSDQTRVVSLSESGYEASITGTASGLSRDGKNYSAAVTDALIVKQSCVDEGIYIPSSGVLSFTYSQITVSVDYGFGTCDKTVEITYPGGAKMFTID
ncbi:hypothetical protein [Algoriphagus confluentis]|uniref:Uncharacterized protein n=1 Tax=Algoriphagus confluentis TaxID=1697556 RepID=A0ABQ6PPP8_9BACT|nr:hypothetical protein Aconfl_25820 [Algoriphagus confluentis]